MQKGFWSSLKSKLEKIIIKEKPDIRICYSAHEWTCLKLIFLMYWVHVYTRIIPNYFKKFYYVDLLAGPGVNYIEETGDYVLGSPLIALRTSYKPFTNYFFFEIDSKRRKTLQVLLERELGTGKYKIYMDCNRELDMILNYFQDQKSHFLAFVDYEGLEVPWSTLSKLLEYRGDVIITFQSSQINRCFGKAVKGNEEMEKKLTDFFGDKQWRNKENVQELLELYKEKLKKTGRGNVENIKVKSEGSFHYDLILAAKLTKSGSPWWKAALHAKKIIESFTSKSVKHALDILTGRTREIEFFFQKTLDNWMNI